MKSGWFWFWVLLALLNGFFAADGKILNLIAMGFSCLWAGFALGDED